MVETKNCEACDQQIGASETTCPRCGVVFAELEETVTAVEKAQTIIEKRRKAAQPPEPQPQPQPAKKNIVAALGRKR